MRTVIGVCGALLVIAACGGESEAPEPPAKVCERYREHLLDVRLAGTTADREAHRAALRQSMGSDFIDRCLAEKTQADIDCAMAAKTADQLRACSSSR